MARYPVEGAARRAGLGTAREQLEERSREVAALAAEVERLRMALGCVRIAASEITEAEVHAIVDLAIGKKGS